MQSSARYSYSQGFTNYRGGRDDVEQGQIDEVLYLHSLFKQGPPPGRRRPRPENAAPSEEGKSNKQAKIETVTEKKKNKKKSKAKKKPERKEKKQPQQPSAEETPEEPGKSQEPENDNKNWIAVSEWDTNNPGEIQNWNSPLSRTVAEPLTEEEQLRFANINLQHRAVRAFKEFLTRGREGESSEEDDEDNEEEAEVEDEEGQSLADPSVESGGAIGKEADAQKFFLKLFEEDQELRQLYEQNCNCGVFECLVCAAVGAKIGKRFPDCVSLIQHAMKILKTKKKAAHRGYGRSICCLLGWNADRLPSGGKPTEAEPRGCIPPPDEEVEEQAPKEDDNDEEKEPREESVSEDATDNADSEKPASN